jgi:hypothetical protein
MRGIGVGGLPEEEDVVAGEGAPPLPDCAMSQMRTWQSSPIRN